MIFSHSQINLYQTCPRKYAYQYIDKMKVESDSLHLVLGSAVHSGLEWLYEQVRNHQVPSLEDVLHSYQDVRTSSIEKTHQRQGPDYFLQEDQEVFYTRGVNYITWYYEKYHPFRDPITMATEQKILIKLGNDINFRGVIDRLDVDGETMIITDYKTNRSFPKDGNDSIKQQITLYALGIMQDYASKVKKIMGNVIYLHMQRPITREITSNQMEKAKDYYIDIAQEIAHKKDIWERGDKDSFPAKQNFQCKGCPFRMICPLWAHGYVSDETVSFNDMGQTTIKSLIDQHAETTMKYKELDKERKEYGKLLGQYGVEHGFNNLYGNEFQVRIGKTTSYRINHEKEDECRKKLKELGLLDGILSIDKNKLAKLFKEGDLNIEEREDMIHISTSYSAGRAKRIKDKDDFSTIIGK